MIKMTLNESACEISDVALTRPNEKYICFEIFVSQVSQVFAFFDK